ncbi:PIN domain-containing protein [bacterium]|nr:PIN domain-containing protein [bacterium]
MNETIVKVAFVDTNIWLYAFLNGQDDPKHATAKTLLQQQCKPVISTQVINEVCLNLLKKVKFTEKQIGQLIESFYEKYRVIQFGRIVLLEAPGLRQRYSLSFWDSLIISSALQSNASILYSEDMQDRLVVDNRLRKS